MKICKYWRVSKNPTLLEQSCHCILVLKTMQYLDCGKPSLIFLTAKSQEETLTMTPSSLRKVENSRKVQYLDVTYAGIVQITYRLYQTYLLTPWSRVLVEKLATLQLVKKFPAFYGTRRFLTALTSARHLSLS